MADRASKRGKSKGDGPATLPAAQLPPGMPPEMFTASGMLAVADLLPIMTAYVDRDEVVRFLNRPLADYLEQPREALLGRSVRAMMGEDTYRDRKPLIEAALAGRAAVLRRRIPPSRRGAAPRSRPNMCRGPMPAGPSPGWSC